MNWLKNLFGRRASVESSSKPNGKDEHEPEEPRKRNGSSVWCDPEMQRQRDAEIEEVKKKSMESHQDLTQAISDFNGFKKTRGNFKAPGA